MTDDQGKQLAESLVEIAVAFGIAQEGRAYTGPEILGLGTAVKFMIDQKHRLIRQYEMLFALIPHAEMVKAASQIQGLEAWDRNDIQFPRLLAEVSAASTPELIRDLATSMDLGPEKVMELFRRAESVWEGMKREVS